MPLADELAAALTHFTATLDGGRKALADRVSGCCDGTGREKPAGLSRPHEFGYAGHLGGKYNAPERHRFHDNDWQSFSKAREYEPAGIDDFGAYPFAACPARYAQSAFQALLFDQSIDLRPKLAVTNHDESEPVSFFHDHGRSLGQEQVALLHTDPADTDETIRIERLILRIAPIISFDPTTNSLHFVPVSQVRPSIELTGAISADCDDEL